MVLIKTKMNNKAFKILEFCLWSVMATFCLIAGIYYTRCACMGSIIMFFAMAAISLLMIAILIVQFRRNKKNNR